MSRKSLRSVSSELKCSIFSISSEAKASEFIESIDLFIESINLFIESIDLFSGFNSSTTLAQGNSMSVYIVEYFTKCYEHTCKAAWSTTNNRT